MFHNSKSFNKFIATATTVTIVAGAVAPLAFAASFNDVASETNTKKQLILLYLKES